MTKRSGNRYTEDPRLGVDSTTITFRLPIELKEYAISRSPIGSAGDYCRLLLEADAEYDHKSKPFKASKRAK